METHSALYVPPEEVEAWLKEQSHNILAYSFLNRPIYIVRWGVGSRKMLIWSQMHGNESTGLRTMMKLGADWNSSPEDYPFLQQFTIIYIPQLNPDGAIAWTRENAQGIDLNRDLRSLSSPEMQAFVQLLKEFNPDYALNLHDQRTTFMVGNKGIGAGLALAIPQCNPLMNWKSAHINNRRRIRYGVLQMLTAGKIDQQAVTYFDESYYPKAVGEFVQEFGAACLLVESGQFKDDWSREESVRRTGEFISCYLNELVNAEERFLDWEGNSALDNPESWGLEPNTPGMCDVILRKVRIHSGEKEWMADIAINFMGKLESGHFMLLPVWEEIGDLSHRKGRREYTGISIEWNVGEKPYQKGAVVPYWTQIELQVGWDSI